MKYIRTSDNIYELNPSDYERATSHDGKTITFYVCTKQNEWIPKNAIVKSSDTIKDLCDDYFSISNTGYKTPIRIDFENRRVYQWQRNGIIVGYFLSNFILYHTIYGAIWVKDKGLIYVAKMDKEGNLNYYEN